MRCRQAAGVGAGWVGLGCFQPVCAPALAPNPPHPILPQPTQTRPNPPRPNPRQRDHLLRGAFVPALGAGPAAALHARFIFSHFSLRRRLASELRAAALGHFDDDDGARRSHLQVCGSVC